MAMGMRLSGPIAPVPREGICVDVYSAPNCDMHPTVASRPRVMPAFALTNTGGVDLSARRQYRHNQR